MKKLIYATMIIVPIIQLVSCKTPPPPISGSVVTQPTIFGEGSYAPDIMFIDKKGRLHNLASFYRDATIIVFVGDDCLYRTDPEVISITSNLRSNVSLVEICSPKTVSKEEKKCKILRGVKEQNLISICDGAGEARALYNATSSTGVFVINRRGIIKDIGKIEELDELSNKANLIAIDEEKRRQMLYDGL